MNGRVFKSTVRLLYFPMLCCVLLSRTHDIVPLLMSKTFKSVIIGTFIFHTRVRSISIAIPIDVAGDCRPEMMYIE